MITVQSSGCAPIVKAWEEGKQAAEMWPNAATMAAGLRVPKPYGDYLILDILKKSHGTAISATDEEILEATRHWAKVEGIFAAPEGAASLVAYRKLARPDFSNPKTQWSCSTPARGLKYLDVLDANVARATRPRSQHNRSQPPAKSAASSALIESLSCVVMPEPSRGISEASANGAVEGSLSAPLLRALRALCG